MLLKVIGLAGGVQSAVLGIRLSVVKGLLLTGIKTRPNHIRDCD